MYKPVKHSEAQKAAALRFHAPSGDDLTDDLPWAKTDAAERDGPRARFDGLGDLQRFLRAGHAIVTVVSKATGARFTFRLRKAEPREGSRYEPPVFVSVLNGRDNETSYAYIGSVFASDPADLRFTAKSRVASSAPSAKAAAWFIRAAHTGTVLDQAEVWHEGRCGRCGRRLTVPESIAAGIGPDCMQRL